MTISSTINRNDYIGNDTTPIYNYAYRVFKKEDIEVYATDTLLSIETKLVLTTDFTVSGVGNSGGGQITLVNAGQSWLSAGGNLDTGFNLSIKRVLTLDQITDIRNQGAFYPEIHEDTFDKLTMIDQQQQDTLESSLRLPASQKSSDLDPTLPIDLAGTPSVSIITSVDGKSLIVGPTSGAISSANADAIAAAASAAAAAISATSMIPFVGAIETISSSTQKITMPGNGEYNILLRVVSNLGGIFVNNSPFSITPVNNIKVSVMGTSDTNRVSIANVDLAGGCLLNGVSVTLRLNDMISFIYIADMDRYIEIGRNF